MNEIRNGKKDKTRTLITIGRTFTIIYKEIIRIMNEVLHSLFIIWMNKWLNIKFLKIKSLMQCTLHNYLRSVCACIGSSYPTRYVFSFLLCGRTNVFLCFPFIHRFKYVFLFFFIFFFLISVVSAFSWI